MYMFVYVGIYIYAIACVCLCMIVCVCIFVYVGTYICAITCVSLFVIVCVYICVTQSMYGRQRMSEFTLAFDFVEARLPFPLLYRVLEGSWLESFQLVLLFPPSVLLQG